MPKHVAIRALATGMASVFATFVSLHVTCKETVHIGRETEGISDCFSNHINSPWGSICTVVINKKTIMHISIKEQSKIFK